MMKNIFTLTLLFFLSYYSFAQETTLNTKQAKEELNELESEILSILQEESKSLPTKILDEAFSNLKSIDSLKMKISKFDDTTILADNLKKTYKDIFDKHQNFKDNLDLRVQRWQSIEENLEKLSARLNDEANKDEITKDIYNPINFTTIYHRKPAENGYASSEKLFNRSSRHFIKREGVLHLEFDREFVQYLTDASRLNLRVKAFIERKDKSVKPIAVLGLTRVETNKISDRTKLLNKKDETPQVTDSYTITYENSDKETISAELAIPFEEISIDDTIIMEITNQSIKGVGFISKFVFADYGWTQGPTGGFSFVQTIDGDDNLFRAAGSAGYAFRKVPKPSAKFWCHFFSPSFGTEINVLQKNNETLVGLGGFISTAANSVKFGLGSYLNGESNKVYFSIGLNFIEGYNTISDLVNIN